MKHPHFVRRLLLSAFAVAGLFSTASSVVQAQDFPSRPMTLVVP
jgi:tripartite-type tricarboxylate transporter receptor subunit TctC